MKASRILLKLIVAFLCNAIAISRRSWVRTPHLLELVKQVNIRAHVDPRFRLCPLQEPLLDLCQETTQHARVFIVSVVIAISACVACTQLEPIVPTLHHHRSPKHSGHERATFQFISFEQTGQMYFPVPGRHLYKPLLETIRITISRQ